MIRSSSRSNKAHLLPACIAAIGLAFSSIATAENYALIMGISNYPIKPLRGVIKDMDLAKKIARTFGVRDTNMTIRRDSDLSRAGVLRALDDFATLTKRGDRVFVYFSGHGTSYTAGTGCAQALVTHDMKAVDKHEFHEKLRPIVDKAGKAFVFLDTCFAGGIVEVSRSRSAADERGEATSKFSPTGANDPCSIGANVESRSTRDFDVEATQTPNYYLLGAAAANEEAIDGGAAVGGFATAAVAQCIGPDANADKNGDGLISLTELRQCAQNKIDEMIRLGRQRPNFLFTRQTLAEGQGPGGNLPLLEGNPQAASSSTPIDAAALLSTIQQAADPRIKVDIKATKQSYKIGTDFLELSVTSSTTGYVTLLLVGSSGNVLKLFPNRVDSNNAIAANTTITLPRPSWRLRSLGPAGRNRLLVVVSKSVDTFADLGQSAGNFQSVANTIGNAQAFVARLSGTLADCKPTQGQRDFGVEDNPCSSSYGAALVDVYEAP